MRVQLLYLEGCPHWSVAEDRLIEALARLGHHEDVRRVRIDTLEQAQRIGFGGSPTILLNGRDLFATAHTAAVLGCRLYPTESGLTGTPTVQQLIQQLIEVLRRGGSAPL